MTGAEHGHDMAVGKRALDGQEIADGGDALEDGAEALDEMIGEH